MFSFQGPIELLIVNDPLNEVSVLLELHSTDHLSTLLVKVVGPSGLEPPTSRLSGARSNLLSYKPIWCF